MSQIKTTEHRKRSWVKARNERAGFHSRLTGRTAAVAEAQDRSERRIRQVNAGDPPGAPQRLWEWVERLVRGDHTRAEPILCGLMEMIEELGFETLEDGELVRERILACTREARVRGGIDLARLKLRSRPRDRRSLELLRTEAPRQAIELIRLAAIAGVELRRLG